jgi:hypothetical protein
VNTHRFRQAEAALPAYFVLRIKWLITLNTSRDAVLPSEGLQNRKLFSKRVTLQRLGLYMHLYIHAKVVRLEIVVVSPAGPGNKNGCAGGAQQQFTRTELNHTYCHAVCMWLQIIWFIYHLYTRLISTSNDRTTANFHSSQITTASSKTFPACCIFTRRSLATVSDTGDSSASRAQVLCSPAPVQNWLSSKPPGYNILARTT